MSEDREKYVDSTSDERTVAVVVEVLHRPHGDVRGDRKSVV